MTALHASPKSLLSMALLVSVLGGCQTEAPPTEERLRAVRTVIAKADGGDRVRTFSGTSKSSQQSRMSFKVAGTLASVPVEVGEELRRGQLIATLSPASYELEAERAQADLAQARANERNTAAIYERTKSLYADNNAAKSDLDAARAQAESAKAQVGAAEKQLELARLNVSYTRLTAATDCSVASVDVEVNENVNAGTTVATVNCGEQLEVELSIPESLISDLQSGMAATVRFDARPEDTFDATITEVGVAARDGATFPVTVAIDGGEQAGALRSGLAAEVSIRFMDPSDLGAILVPLSAVLETPEGVYVFLAEATDVEGEAVVSRRAVELGELTAGGLEIRSGLSPGDRVITAGTSMVREGLRVLVPNVDATTES